MKVLVFFVVLCALIGVNRAYFERNYGHIEGHEDVSNEKSWIGVDPSSTSEIESSQVSIKIE